jgi:hypothetical protein
MNCPTHGSRINLPPANRLNNDDRKAREVSII